MTDYRNILSASDPSQWTIEEVCEFLRDRGLSERVQDIYRYKLVDGADFLKQTPEDVKKWDLSKDDQADVSHVSREIDYLKRQMRECDETSIVHVILFCVKIQHLIACVTYIFRDSDIH